MAGRKRDEGLIQFYELLALLKVCEHVREKGLKPLDERCVGAVSDPDPDHGRGLG